MFFLILYGIMIPSLKLTFPHLKMDGWNTFSFSFGARPIFRCKLAVSFTECTDQLFRFWKWWMRLMVQKSRNHINWFQEFGHQECGGIFCG